MCAKYSVEKNSRKYFPILTRATRILSCSLAIDNAAQAVREPLTVASRPSRVATEAPVSQREETKRASDVIVRQVTKENAVGRGSATVDTQGLTAKPQLRHAAVMQARESKSLELTKSSTCTAISLMTCTVNSTLHQVGLGRVCSPIKCNSGRHLRLHL